MSKGFSFTLVEESEEVTNVIFLQEDREVVEYILDSYDFEFSEKGTGRFVIQECIDDIFNDLTDFEINEGEKVELLEGEDEGFFFTPNDEVFEIENILYLGDLGDNETLEEGAPKRNVVIRKGKRKIIFKCGPGQMKVGKSCRRRPTAQLNKMKRRARLSARKARKKRRMAMRKRKLSMRKRATLVKKKPKVHHAVPPAPVKRSKPAKPAPLKKPKH